MTAIPMAVTLVEEKIDDYTNDCVSTDNQSSIKAVEHPGYQSG
jgi:hypothetical protein